MGVALYVYKSFTANSEARNFSAMNVTQVNKSLHKSTEAMHELKLADSHVYFSATLFG